MATPTAIAAYVALFALTGFLFLFVNLLVGWLVRPRLPNVEKLEVYECGEPTIGSSFVQFDLRFYVVALLFIIFDVEVAFFFPWAAVFGKATQLAASGSPVIAADLDPNLAADQRAQLSDVARTQLRELGITDATAPTLADDAAARLGVSANAAERSREALQQSARKLALISMVDIAVFFAVLLVGFAYVWKRGDLDWVRATTRQRGEPVIHRTPPVRCWNRVSRSCRHIEVEADFMAGPAFVEQLKTKFGDKIAGANFENIDPWIEVAPDGLLEVCRYLRDEPTLAFNFLNCISGVDYLHTDEKKAAKSEWQPHTEVVYHLFSMRHKHSLVLKVILPRWKSDKPGELPEVPSVSGLWSTADWHEREVYDLNGVYFTGHPNLRRILCPEDWVGHPLRKDYEMPLEYHGIRGR